MASMCTNMDNFKVMFPHGGIYLLYKANTNEKALLTSAAMFIDY